MMMKSKRLVAILLLCILLGGLLVRLYRFDNPIADWHSWRQAETASVARNFATHGFDLLHPRMDNISNVQSGMDNPEGYFFVEFPLYNAAQAGAFLLMPVVTIEQWGRLITIVSSLLAAVFLFLIVTKHSNKELGLLAAFFYTFIPFNIYYGRVILADTSMVAAMLGGIYFFDRWVDYRSDKKSSRKKEWMFLGLATLFTAAAFLLKPIAVFFVVPIIYLAFKRFGLKTFIQWPLWLYAVLALAPVVWWRIWMQQFPEGIPANAWLLNGNGIRFRPSFFRWIVYERLTLLISGYFGMVFVLFGLFKLKKVKESLFFVSFLVSSTLYVTVFATGNVQHDYYQIPIMPSIAIMFAVGSYFLAQWSVKKVPIGMVLVVICVAGSFFFGWQRVKDYFNINNPSIIVAGKAVDRVTPKDAKIVANYNGDTSFLYQANRKGWASFQDDMPVLIKKGADYLVIVNPVKADDGWKGKYKVIEQTQQYIIFDLKGK